MTELPGVHCPSSWALNTWSGEHSESETAGRHLLPALPGQGLGLSSQHCSETVAGTLWVLARATETWFIFAPMPRGRKSLFTYYSGLCASVPGDFQGQTGAQHRERAQLLCAQHRAVPSRDTQVHSRTTELPHLSASAWPKHKKNRSALVYFEVLSAAAFSLLLLGCHMPFPIFIFQVGKTPKLKPQQYWGSSKVFSPLRSGYNLSLMQRRAVSILSCLPIHPCSFAGAFTLLFLLSDACKLGPNLASLGIRNCSMQRSQGQAAPDKHSMT